MSCAIARATRQAVVMRRRRRVWAGDERLFYLIQNDQRPYRCVGTPGLDPALDQVLSGCNRLLPQSR